MDKTLALYDQLNRAGVSFYHWDLDDQQAATIEIDGKYAIFMDFDNIRTCAQERVVVAHEGGHVATGATHKVCSPYDLVAKHEYKADKWAVQRLIPKEELSRALAGGCTDIYNLAEYFGVTVPFMEKAISLYKYGNLNTKLKFQ